LVSYCIDAIVFNLSCKLQPNAGKSRGRKARMTVESKILQA
jgi:hypothetical protein